MDELEELQDEVLRGIGRNVLNIQKMEGMLKSLVMIVKSSAPVEGSEAVIEQQGKAIWKTPMGPLVDDFVRSVRPANAETEGEVVQSETATVSVSVRFTDGEFVDELEASLRLIVKERNDLIHMKLLNFDPKSPEACRKLALELEDQRQRIRPQFEALKAIWLGMREHQQELRKFIHSAEFEEELRRVTEEEKQTSH